MTDWLDKVVVIMGAGMGIGKSLAVKLARRGAVLVLADMRIAIKYARKRFGDPVVISGSSQGGITSFYIAAEGFPVAGALCHNIGDLGDPGSVELTVNPALSRFAKPFIMFWMYWSGSKMSVRKVQRTVTNNNIPERFPSVLVDRFACVMERLLTDMKILMKMVQGKAEEGR